jgi:single-strand DNA-binding protein
LTTTKGSNDMAGDTTITIVGNLVDDPELRFTPSGAAVAKFRIASTPRIFDRASNEWKDGDSLFLTCNVWRQAAEHVAESLEKGMRVLVQGRLKQRSYETKEGEKRTVFEVEVDEVGPSLRNASAKVTKVQRSSGGGGGDTAPRAAGDDPWRRSLSPEDRGLLRRRPSPTNHRSKIWECPDIADARCLIAVR